ncbi:PEP/pyruvate-binding domain-containing protein [Actinoplanes solisilvae]|uniref:PEP/pyruvate-binding domain-containing protein n=1 Tax=Actinoplanes solisilvae TaxID=2486853 RepID=UPI0013E2935B|nr:PEP/pyruvate-binding domain-containing protein [Actinoplanes solisilvae]
MDATMVRLAEAVGLGQEVVGGKAAALAKLAAGGFAVPAGFIITGSAHDDPALDDQVLAEAERLGGTRFAVRSSAAAEDLPDASYAGLYDTVLDVAAERLGAAVRECFAGAGSSRVAAYRQHRGGDAPAMAVLVQVMIDAVAAGVAFTAHPVTGDRNQILVTATHGPGEALVSGRAAGEEWVSADGRATLTRRGPTRVLSGRQARAVVRLAGRAAALFGRPQDVEWAIDRDGHLWMLQSRPMTALPPPATWRAPGPGLWMRNFRLGEWLPEPVTPLFATWLLPLIEAGYLDGMQATVGVRVPFRWELVNGWYYNAAPIPSPALLARVLRHGRRTATILFHALVQAGRNPVAADRAVLTTLDQQWREQELPRYRQLVAAATAEIPTADPHRLVELVDQLGRQAGIALWYLAIVGGSAWKMEACLTRFTRRHLAAVLTDHDGGSQSLLRGLPGATPTFDPHAVHSADWYHPTAAELPAPADGASTGDDRQAGLAPLRRAAEHACVAALAGQPRRLARFAALLRVTQRYTVIREQQARTFTLAWPALRDCALRLGRHLLDTGAITDVDDVFFRTRAELGTALAGSPVEVTTRRRARWQQQQRLPAPLSLGRPPRLIGDVIARTVARARPAGFVAEAGGEVIVGHPASAGQAAGPVRIITDPHDFATFGDGDVLVAKATAPAWTPLFARAAAVVTDGGTLAAHASLIAREYGIPAVVGTGTATTSLRTGQRVTVNGTNGTVTVE